MKIMVTGGTGFVGSHVCRQLMAGGHSVRLLVRDPDKARALYQSFAEPVPELIVGDVTDIESVRASLVDCAAVVHAAASTPMRKESLQRLFDVNVGGVKNVVSAALASGIQHIVYLSSITAIFDPDGSKVTADAMPSPSKMPYGQSKVEAELYLRALQDEGKPIAIVYPGGIIGPDDPGLSDAHKGIKHRIENGFYILGDGGMQYVDVRDLAALICSLIETGGRGRFLIPGVYCTWLEQAGLIERVCGYRLQRISAQGWKLRLVGRLMDFVRMFRRIDSPISAETMRYATLWPQIENTQALAEHGLGLRDVRETLNDTLLWMLKAGHLQPEYCPKLGDYE